MTILGGMLDNLRSLFEKKADTRHWMALRQFMEQHYGRVHTVYTDKNEITAFFEKGVFLDQSPNGKPDSAMHEAIATGRDSKEAIIALFDLISQEKEPQRLITFHGDHTKPSQDNAKDNQYEKSFFKDGQVFYLEHYPAPLAKPERLPFIQAELNRLYPPPPPPNNIYQFPSKGS